MESISNEALLVRARNLKSKKVNGIEMARIELPKLPQEPATLELFFYHELYLESLEAHTPEATALLFRLRGGLRKPAGSAAHQVKLLNCLPGSLPNSLFLQIAPVGDYSSYSLNLLGGIGIQFDPLFARIEFRFRPGCFHGSCAPLQPQSNREGQIPPIDYLAKDYGSFRETLIQALVQRVPGWEPSSEAQLEMVLIEQFAYAADRLSDFQDRVINEAFFKRARKRVSLARHARLLDDHIHQGNQASCWIRLFASEGESFELPAGALFSNAAIVPEAPEPLPDPPAPQQDPLTFATRQAKQIDARLNQFHFHDWDGAITSLPKGATSAELSFKSKQAVEQVLSLLQKGSWSHLLLAQIRDPKTGTEANASQALRQVVALNPTTWQILADPFHPGTHVLQINWRSEDALRFELVFAKLNSGKWENHLAQAFGNLVRACHGVPRTVRFIPPPLPSVEECAAPKGQAFYHYEQGWTLCPLPHRYLAYQNTPTGGEVAPHSSIRVVVSLEQIEENWHEVISLADRQDGEQLFLVESDERGWSKLRFGNGIQGQQLPEGAEVVCRYQTGRGLDGNIGAGCLSHFEQGKGYPIVACDNPLPAVDGRAPESVDAILRRVPEAYRQRQARAVTLQDYAEKARELAGVSRAQASYGWNGSWRQVRVMVDPQQTTSLEPALRQALFDKLEPLRMIGEELLILPPRYVAADIRLVVRLLKGLWPEQVRDRLESAFSAGEDGQGGQGFFHPDRWSFGRSLHLSQILGQASAVHGVALVVRCEMRRWRDQRLYSECLPIAPDEILLCESDPNQLERGRIQIEILGSEA